MKYGHKVKQVPRLIMSVEIKSKLLHIMNYSVDVVLKIPSSQATVTLRGLPTDKEKVHRRTLR